MIRATIPAGMTASTVHGLHQWDYGQQLVVEADGLPSLVEVHFACAGMKEAVVRSCSTVDGTVTAVIPDQCLEQTSPVIAWVYGDDENTGTAGRTLLTLTLYITARTRPQPSATIPTSISDKYTEAVAAMNEAVAKVASGAMRVASAVSADSATNATKAASADFAQEAQLAYNAYDAQVLTPTDTHVINTAEAATVTIPGSGIYVIEVKPNTSHSWHTVVLVVQSVTQLARATICADAYVVTDPNGTGKLMVYINDAWEQTNQRFRHVRRIAEL